MNEEHELFTYTDEEMKEISSFLCDIGCCVRCILRFLGERQPHSYTYSSKDLERKLKQEEKPSESSTSHSSCPACLGILQKYTERSYLSRILQTVKSGGYEFSEYQCSLILPVSLIIRQKAIYIHLRRNLRGIYSTDEESIPNAKDVWKWASGPTLSTMLQAKFQNRSSFDILLNFEYQDSEKECSFLLDADPDTFRRRKQKKYGFETFTRANVAKAIASMTDSEFEKLSPCPPALATHQMTDIISCTHNSIFIAGRYQKYSRVLSQTPWISDGKRVMEGSVEEIICGPMIAMFKPSETRLSSSGREDVDVRMLGIGRPFIIELINPRRVKFSSQDIKTLQKNINVCTTDVQVRDLQVVRRVDTNKLKEGEINKTKSYSALCWCDRDLKQVDLDMLSSIKDLTLHQKTPLRVLHRRTAMTRERVIHSVNVKEKQGNTFRVHLLTQAGTYVKEFVHGDFGRTFPNMCQLLQCQCDIIDLDVESVDVNWPPIIDGISSEASLLTNPEIINTINI